MASLAHSFFRSEGRKISRGAEAGSGLRTVGVSDSEPGTQDPYQLRPLPNEEVYLFLKSFDNAGVVRQADPAARRVAWKTIGAAGVAAAFLVVMLLPGAYRLLAGYQIDRLKQSREQAVKELRTLEYEEEFQRRMPRMNELAKSKEFAPPTRDQVEFVQPKDSVAQLQNTR